jgi:hypothetical protein
VQIRKSLRTPDGRFNNLPGYVIESHYLNVPDGEDGRLRIHYVDEGAKEAEPVLLIHGEPSWSYLYRKMIPIFVHAGYRAVAPDLVGFGRSDKPTDRKDYTYQRHVDWMQNWLDRMDLKEITFFGQESVNQSLTGQGIHSGPDSPEVLETMGEAKDFLARRAWGPFRPSQFWAGQSRTSGDFPLQRGVL